MFSVKLCNHIHKACPGDKGAALFPTVISMYIMEIFATTTFATISQDS